MGVSLCMALLAWADRGDADVQAAQVPGEQHQLGPDQAACLRYGLVTTRSETRSLTVVLGSYSTLDPTAADLLRTEVRELDAIGGDYPEADFRLINAVAAAADADALVLARGSTVVYRSTVTGRGQALSEVEAACREIAAFDTTELRVDEGGTDE
jgi:hypothetical protein